LFATSIDVTNITFIYGWLVAFIYSFSPISFYWVAITGYNGPIIAFFVMPALILSERGKDVWASISMASFLCCKLLAFLAWPGIVFYTRHRWAKRLSPAIALVLLFAVLPMTFGVDTLMPLKLEFFKSTSGNVWYLISAVFPGLKESRAFQVLPVASFALASIPLFILFLREKKVNADSGFDRAVAFIATSNLLFMILSKKAYTFYMAMTLLFLIHTIVRYRGFSVWHVLALAFMGATTTLEPYLYIYKSDQIRWLFGVDTVVIGCYAYYAVLCFICSLSSSGLRLKNKCAGVRRSVDW
jgi:hypothetical protein